LIQLFNGKIIIIDEFDANINEVFLLRLLHFIKGREIGQLIFTTHNAGIMNELCEIKKGIDYITENLKINTWRKNGNYNIYNQYIEGNLEGLPFNYDDSDFLGIFDEQ